MHFIVNKIIESEVFVRDVDQLPYLLIVQVLPVLAAGFWCNCCSYTAPSLTTGSPASSSTHSTRTSSSASCSSSSSSTQATQVRYLILHPILCIWLESPLMGPSLHKPTLPLSFVHQASTFSTEFQPQLWHVSQCQLYVAHTFPLVHLLPRQCRSVFTFHPLHCQTIIPRISACEVSESIPLTVRP